eukprot:TRINITY_DN1068_c0_g1_i2.p2 TRINITY_DN1068_c0_g1~~TRINITY_DN1068_c0_g1_i2.p2  ORF type:complete len:175 (-),score=26.26 TRINITY_DN1068_c0_g1_i2:33-557(-)
MMAKTVRAVTTVRITQRTFQKQQYRLERLKIMLILAVCDYPPVFADKERFGSIIDNIGAAFARIVTAITFLKPDDGVEISEQVRESVPRMVKYMLDLYPITVDLTEQVEGSHNIIKLLSAKQPDVVKYFRDASQLSRFISRTHLYASHPDIEPAHKAAAASVLDAVKEMLGYKF